MIPRLALVALGLVLAAEPLARSQAAAPAQANPQDWIAALEAALTARKDDAKREEADGKAVEAIDHLTNEFGTYDDKGKKAAVSAIGKVFALRLEPDDERLYAAGAAALSEMGEPAAGVLQKALKLKHVEKRPATREKIIEALGKHKDPKNIDQFADLLDDQETVVSVAAIKALGMYRDAEVKIRKRATELLVKEYSNRNALDLKEKTKNPVFHDRLLAIEMPMNEALGGLTLQQLRSAPEWEKWFNDNRNAKW